MQKKVLIQTTEYFTRESWEKSLKDFFPDFKKHIRVQYFTTKNELDKLLIECEACFLIQYVGGINIEKLKLMYLGISDIDYLDKYDFSNEMQIYSSKGIASAIVAEYSLMTSLALIRNFQYAIMNKLKKRWDQGSFLKYHTGSIRNYKIGVLGLGNNGKAIVEIFKSIGCWVAGYSNNEKVNMDLDSWFSSDRLGEILVLCDIIIVSLPLRSETKHLIGLKELKSIGSDSYLINVARGDVINENDLIFALSNQIIKAAAIDVCSIEPLPKKSKLWKTTNLIISPHVAGNINYLTENIQKDFINKVMNLLS